MVNPGLALPSRRGAIAWRRSVPGLVLCFVLAVSCGAPTGRELRSDASRVAPDAAAATGTVDALNAFSLDIGRTLATSDGNVAVATYPLARSLAMVRLGAREATRAALDRALHTDLASDFDLGFATVDRSLDDLEGERRSATRKGSIDITMPAVLWTQEETVVAPALLDALSSSYDSGVRLVDFRSEPDEARNAINRWAARATRDTVDLLVPRGEITDFTRFVAAAAGALRAPWAVRFDPAETAEAPFTRLDGQRVPIAAMTAHDQGAIRSARSDRWDAIELPYLGGELAMLMVVPAAGRFDEVAGTFDTDSLRGVTESLAPRPVQLRIPRFQFTSVLNLDEELGSLGLSDLFSNEHADLSGITGDEVLSLSDVVHGTYVAADEEGTDGDAVTVVPPTVTTSDETLIDVDRPFLFFVRDRVTGLVLQLGRVLEPQE